MSARLTVVCDLGKGTHVACQHVYDCPGRMDDKVLFMRLRDLEILHSKISDLITEAKKTM